MEWVSLITLRASSQNEYEMSSWALVWTTHGFSWTTEKIGKALKLKLRSCYLFCSDFCGVLEWWTLEQGLPVGFLSSKIFKLSHSFSISHVLKGSIYYRPAIIFYIREELVAISICKRELLDHAKKMTST